MSHITNLETKIKDFEAIEEAIEVLGYSIEKNGHARGYKGELTKGEYIVKLNCNYDLIIEKDYSEEGVFLGYKIGGDFFMGYIEDELGKNCGKLLQQYNMIVTEKEAKKRGYHIVKEKSRDGIVKYILKDISR